MRPCGDTLSLQGLDPLLNGPGFLIAGPPRSGKSNGLQVILQTQISQGKSIIAFAPRISPLRNMQVSRKTRLFTGTEPIEEIRAALSGLGRDHVVLVDDFEVIGGDSPLGVLLTEHYATLRDSTSIMAVAASTDEVMSLYRGLPMELKRGRTGVILAPRASNDGDVLNARLPRSVGASMPVGRGVLTNASGFRWVQIPKA